MTQDSTKGKFLGSGTIETPAADSGEDTLFALLKRFRVVYAEKLHPRTPYKLRLRGFAIQLYSVPQPGYEVEHALESEEKWLLHSLNLLLD